MITQAQPPSVVWVERQSWRVTGWWGVLWTGVLVTGLLAEQAYLLGTPVLRASLADYWPVYLTVPVLVALS